ncbi:MAG: RlmE family RNA methyltransferase [Betaproteobacteria bacterium]|jgi:23S rRNA (uridine2552-2'-O)-methyltransferase|nr:23S rRNA methyltransferase [Betaproteobacteria bacterium UKL13-2]HCG53499.1 23S rRNA methyltransferase [Betaproteobacteria bacterium]
MSKARPKNSRDWVKRHLSDPYVKKANEEGYRSRAVYKLQEIDQAEKLIKPGMVIVDLGSAPGGWSQMAIKKVGTTGKVVAIDLLPMEAIERVHFIQADFSADAGLDAVVEAIENQPVDLVISDMAPNLTGIVITDQARLYALGELAMEFAARFLKLNGVFLVKVFQGDGFEPFVKLLRSNFVRVDAKKPDASRDESREVYLLARGVKHPEGIPQAGWRVDA